MSMKNRSQSPLAGPLVFSWVPVTASTVSTAVAQACCSRDRIWISIRWPSQAALRLAPERYR